MNDLAAQFGIHRTNVAHCLRKLNVPLRRQGLSPDQLHQAVLLYEQGWSTERIGQHFDCSAETVRTTFIRAGIPRRGRMIASN